MKKIIVLSLAAMFVAGSALATGRPAPVQVGGQCYGFEPVCFGLTYLTCVCDQFGMNCKWACVSKY